MFKELGRFDTYRRLNPNELTTLQLSKLENEIKHQQVGIITDEYYDFKLWCLGLHSRQERFADLLVKRLPKKDNLKVLEVGCGRTAKLSRILNEKGFIMTCVDPKLDISYCNNIEGIKSEIDYRKIDLSQYDYVIAQEPCDATEHIVRACISQHKPFMIILCGVPHKLISGITPKSVDEWYNFLVNISRNEIKLRYMSLDPLGKTPILKSDYS